MELEEQSELLRELSQRLMQAQDDEKAADSRANLHGQAPDKSCPALGH